MRKAREILRLKYEVGLGQRDIARSQKVSLGTVGNYLSRAEAAGIGWPLPKGLGDKELSRLLFASQRQAEEARRPLPDMAQVHKELRGKSVTLQLLWEEYRREHPEGYGYTQFCEYYKRFVSSIDPVLRQSYTAGEKLFVDWAGQTVPIHDPNSGAMSKAYLFVATLGASNYTFAALFADMRLDSWIEAHVQAWEFFGGVAQITVPDNTKTAVSGSCRYEPKLQRAYEDLAQHYGTVIIPARPREPQDKAKVEEGVQNAERRILAALRHARFFSVTEANAAVRRELEALNLRPFKKLPGCRFDLFCELDRPALKALPAKRYERSQWRKARANIDYHVQVDWHFYSVPSPLANQAVEVRLSARSVELFHDGKRVAAHSRSPKRGGFTTDPAHRPKSHQRHSQWTPSRLISWAQLEVGTQCARAVETLLRSKPHPEQGYRACLGIMRLARQYGSARLEAACHRAVLLDTCSYRSIKSILATSADRQPLGESVASSESIDHDNLRGKSYYN